MICRRLAGKSWGCNPYILRWMYTMMVRPIITYGAIAWGKRANLITARKELEKIQRLACVCITGSMRSCPTAAMEVLLELTPLHIVVENVAQKTLVRLCDNKSVNRVKMDPCDFATLSKRYPLINAPKDHIDALIRPTCKFKTQISSKSEWINESIQYSIQPHTIKWYTDGSKTEDGAGAGIFGPRFKHAEPLGKYANIFQAELYAISRCAETNIGRNYRNKSIAILTDSQAAIKALNSHTISSGIVWECFKSVNRLANCNDVTIYWVPGHVGVYGNEEADKLARLAAETKLCGPEPFCGIGAEFIRQEINSEEYKLRNRHWMTHAGLRQAKELLGNYNQKRFKIIIKMSKTQLRIITGLLTGHCKMNGHLRKLKLVNNSSCRFCDDEDETPAHILTECAPLCIKRRRYLGSYLVNLEDIQSMNPLRLLNFIKAIDLWEVL